MRPLCMDPDELARWEQANRTLTQPAPTPCFDCVDWWAEAMRAQGRCNGEPGEPVVVRPSRSERRRAENRLASQRWRERQRAMLDAAHAERVR